jgi:hypothetical protein
MYLQEEQVQPQQCDDACVQQTHFVGEHMDKRHDEKYHIFERKYGVSHIHPPISLHSNNFPSKLAFNILLKIKKHLIHIRTLFEQINPGELAEIINKAYIVCIFPNRKRSWTRYIRKDLFQRNSGSNGRDGIWQLVTLG